jgi:hypothetical protein
MRKTIFETHKDEFDEYFKSKSISQTISKKFLPSFYSHIEENKDSFKFFWKFIKENYDRDIKETIDSINTLSKRKKLNKTFYFVCDWSYSYLGPGELMILLLSSNSYSGGKRNPDILFRDSTRKIEIKSYVDNFRLTEATSFFTDLGTIIQALVQGGFLNSLTDINNNEIKKGIGHFCESFLCPRGYIELNSNIWKLEEKTDDTITFKLSEDSPKEYVKYSMVRNSLRNWLGRGLLSLKLAEIIDPNRTRRVLKKELEEYTKGLMGVGDLAPIPLEQYFILCSLDSMIIYEKKDKESPFQYFSFEDLNKFTLDRIGQAKVSYKKKLLSAKLPKKKI